MVVDILPVPVEEGNSLLAQEDAVPGMPSFVRVATGYQTRPAVGAQWASYVLG